MQIPPEQLVDGCVETLQHHVLPAVGSRFARGQLYAVADVLRNLRDRIEEKGALAEGEAVSARGALAAAAGALRGAADAAARALGAEIEAGIPAEDAGPAAARLEALRAAVSAALERLDGAAGDGAAGARAALGGHLAAQAVREVMLLKPSLLAEISKG